MPPFFRESRPEPGAETWTARGASHTELSGEGQRSRLHRVSRAGAVKDGRGWPVPRSDGNGRRLDKAASVCGVHPGRREADGVRDTQGEDAIDLFANGGGGGEAPPFFRRSGRVRTSPASAALVIVPAPASGFICHLSYYRCQEHSRPIWGLEMLPHIRGGQLTPSG